MNWRRTLAIVAGLVAALLFIYREVLDGQLLTGRDVFRIFIPDSALLRDSLAAFEWPLWNPWERMGQPFAATLQAQAFYLPRVLCVLAFGPLAATTALQILHVVIAFVGVHWFLEPLVRRSHARWAAAAVFALGPMFTDLAMQPNLVCAAAWSGFLLGAAHRGHWRLFAALVAMSLLAAAPEITLWQLFFCAVITWQPRSAPWKPALATIAGFGLAAMTLVPALELTGLSLRSDRNFISGDWSMSWWQCVATFWPLFDMPRDGYWGGDQQLVFNVFLGTLAVALAIAGAFSRARLSRRIAWVTVLLLLFSLGNHLWPVRVLLNLPPFMWFRYPAKALIGAAFGVALLAGFGLDAMPRLARRFNPRRRWALAVVGLALALVPLLRLLPLRAAAPTGLVWLVASLGLAMTLFCVLPPGPRRPSIWGWTIAALCLFELMLAQAVLRTPEYTPIAALRGTGVIEQLLPHPFVARVSSNILGVDGDYPGDEHELIANSRDLLIANRFVEAHVPAVEGYDPLEPRRAELLAMHATRGFYDLAGVTHFIRGTGAPFGDLKRAGALPGGAALYESTTAMPRAFVVQRAVLASDDEALRAIEDAALEQPFRHTVFLAEGTPREGTSCESTVNVGATALRTASFDVDACDDGFLVMTDSHFPGWTAHIDGVETPVLRADYAFRAVPVSKGRHSVTLSYWPRSFSVGLGVSLLSALALVLSLVGWRRKSVTA